MDLTIFSYNYNSFIRKNINIMRELTSMKIDLILLQETFMTSENMSVLNYAYENYNSIGVRADFSENCIRSLSGRPQGGLAVLWRKDSCFTVELIHNANDLWLCLFLLTVLVIVNVQYI